MVARDETPVGQPRRAAGWLAAVGLLLVLAGAVVLLIPTYTHQDMADVGDDTFFSCGGAVYHTPTPAEEPGVTACREVNESFLRWGLILVAGGALTATGGWVLRRRAP